MSNEILCVGDIHLGREPGRVPGDLLDERGMRRAELSAAEAWKRTVREALRREVSAVLLAGDVVDSDDGYLSAYAPLAEGVRDLIRAGVAVIAVAGNHDTEVLPRLAEEIDGLRLLGAKGRWDHELIEVDGAPIARIVGWSFPKRQVHQDPLEDLPANFATGEFGDGADVPIIGLVHGDLDANGGAYAPLSRKRLEATNYAGWLLGHVHKPHDLSGDRPLGYLGCLSGNDPGEAGVRGPWIAQLDQGRLQLEQLPLAPLRWEELAIDVDGVRSVEQLERTLTHALKSLDARRMEAGCAARVVGVRPVLTGRSSVSARVRSEVLRKAREQHYPGADGATYFFDRRLRDEARPLVDLEELGRGTDPPAVLAQLVMELEADGPGCRALIEGARSRMQDEADHSNFTGMPGLEVSRDDARAALLKSGRAALEALLEQRADQATSDLQESQEVTA
jgi:DNA repair protein SbcD/Mre11